MTSCKDCTKGYILPGEPKGKIVDGDYYSPAPAGDSTAKRAVILFSDAFGLPLVNNKILADMFAEKLNCDVWTPDLFNGKPMAPVGSLDNIMPEKPGQTISLYQKLQFAKLMIPRIAIFWSNRPSVVDKRIEAFFEKIKQKGYAKLGAVGYCYGGSRAIALGAKSPSVVDALVICHPGGDGKAAYDAIKLPTSWACAEDDMGFKPELRKQAEESFEKRSEKLDYEFKDYKGTCHGFAARPNLSDPEIKAGFEGAFEQGVAWFQKHLAV